MSKRLILELAIFMVLCGGAMALIWQVGEYGLYLFAYMLWDACVVLFPWAVAVAVGFTFGYWFRSRKQP